MTSPAPNTPPLTPTDSGSGYGRLIGLVFLLCLIGGGVYAYFYFQNPEPGSVDESLALKSYLQERGKHGRLAEGLQDKDQDLVADPPTDANQLLDVKELCFTEIASDDPSKLAVVWEPFRKHLEAKTGLKVKYLSHLDLPPEPAVPAPAPVPGDQGDEHDPEPSSPNGVTHLNQQLDLMKTGKLHVTAFSTGQVPMAVNQVGFVPLYAPATKEGNFAYEVQVIVPTDSAVKDLKDLKGKTIAFVSLSSNSGGRAPIVRLREKAGLTILKDYRYVLTGSHWNSIHGVCFGRDAAAILANKNSREESRKAVLDRPGPKYDAASVASDLLAREVASGAVKENQFRTIYRDGPYPSLCFGVSHNLRPELVAKIKDAFETFSFEGNSVGEKYKDSNQVKFIKVDYKKDWQAVREIDQMLPDAVEGK